MPCNAYPQWSHRQLIGPRLRNSFLAFFFFFFIPLIMSASLLPPVRYSIYCSGAPPPSLFASYSRDHNQLLVRERGRKRERDQLVATVNAPHIQTKREDRSARSGELLVSPVDTITQLPPSPNNVRGILWQHPLRFTPLLASSVSPPFLLSHLSSLLLTFEHPPLFASLLACLANFFHPTPSHTTSSIAHQSPGSFTLQSCPYCSSLPWIVRNLFGQSSRGTATWGARSRSENGLLSVSRRPAEPVGIGIVGARLRLFLTSPVLSGPVRYGSVRGVAGTARGAPTAAPVERDGGRLAQDHPRLVSRHFTCGAAARLPFVPQRLPDAHRLELLRWESFHESRVTVFLQALFVLYLNVLFKLNM